MDGILEVMHLDDSRLSLVVMSLVATSTTWIAYRLIACANPVSQILSIAIYFILYVIVRGLQCFHWALNGVWSHRKALQRGDNYEHSVQVRRIIHKGRLSTMNHPRPWDFLGVHQGFIHPNELLRPNVTLYCITQTHAYFVQCPKHIDVHSSKVSPFMYMAQFEYAIKFYSMPLVHFHRLAGEVGDPKVPVLWISSTGRCGSTLLIQMLENIPDTICMSEPDVTTNICLMSRALQVSDNEISRMVQSSTRLLCKESASVQRIVIKTRFNCSTELLYVQHHFPQFKHMYLYRNMGHVVRSYYKFLHRDLAICLLEQVFNSKIISFAIPALRRYQIHFIAGETSKIKLSGLYTRYTFMGFVAALIASCIAEFQRLLDEKAITMPTLHYDELMRSPLEVTKRLFEVMEYPLQHVPAAMKAFEYDSQEGTILSNMSNVYNKKMTARDYKDINLVLSLLGLPDMTESFTLPYSIQL